MQPQDQERRQPSPPSATAARSWSVVVTSEALRRRVYLWATLLGIGILIATWLTQVRRPDPDLYVLYVHPVILLQCVWIVWWLLLDRALIVAERVVFMITSLSVLTQLLLATVAGQQLVGLTSSAYWTLVALSILSFLIFSNRQALLFTAALFTLSVVVPWGTLIARGDPLSNSAELARVQLTCGVVLALLSGLAWYRENFAVERGQRLSLEHLAHTDPLTGVPNRRALYREIEDLLEGTRGVAGGLGRGGCLILLDVDHFKRINDTFGHNVGDDVLIRLAALIRADLRGGDTVGRWGGEEFLITLPGLSLALGEQVAERLRQKLERQPFEHGQGVTASLGVTGCRSDDDLRSCTARVDRALYLGKAAGRNRVVSLPADEALLPDAQLPDARLPDAQIPGTEAHAEDLEAGPVVLPRQT
ncbi:GGDEF domain-containing protein [Deinococcus altitudinis]|uniref:GGDEF domain-containing protein n=1 Tax=Deinococcus altitudinis TaxID=468914 RepID=UPI0038919C63